MKKLALTMLAQEDIANCRKTGKKRSLKKIAETLERLLADETETVGETATDGETAVKKEEAAVTEAEQTEMLVSYYEVGRKYRVFYSSTPEVVTVLALQEKGDIRKKK